MDPIVLILIACANAYLMSSSSSYEREIVDGGTQNRIWTFIIQTAVLAWSMGPLWLVFPEASLLASVLYYSALATSGLFSYIASICHANQMKRNLGQEETRESINWSAIEWSFEGIYKLISEFFSAQDKIEPLPFDLHNNSFFVKTIMFFNQNLIYAIGALYLTGVILAGIYIAPSYAIAAAAMFAVDRCYQNGLFPKFMETIYFISTSFLVLGYLSGFDSWLNIGITAASITYALYDYIQIHLRGVNSPSTLFPMATSENELSLEKIIGQECENQTQLRYALSTFQSKTRPVRVTFNHFHASYELSERVFANAPQVDFRDYKRHFNELDFNSPEIRTSILNEMAVHDKFHGEPLEQHQKNLNLPEQSDIEDIYIAYLKNEMNYLVERLTNISYRDLNNQQVNALQGQARHLLDHLNKTQNTNDKINLLISLAIRTGAHCNRIYLEVFSELSQDVCPPVGLTLKEQVIFDAQSAREGAFRKYYYILAKKIGLDYMFDLNDYHTYENFAAGYGQYFYLRNASLSQRVRTISDFINEKILSNILIYDASSFSDYYTESFLVNEVLQGKLHPSFQAWCAEIYPNCYDEMVLDNDSLVKTNAPTVQALAKLMLLDCGIVELIEPYVPADHASPSKADETAEERMPAPVPLAASLWTEAAPLREHTARNNVAETQRSEIRRYAV